MRVSVTSALTRTLTTSVEPPTAASSEFRSSIKFPSLGRTSRIVKSVVIPEAGEPEPDRHRNYENEVGRWPPRDGCPQPFR